MKKILVIGLWNSIHLKRWLDQFKDQKIQFIIFQSEIAKHINVNNKNVKFFKPFFFNNFNFIVNKFLFYLFGEKWILFLLKICFKIYNPNIVHTIEIHRAGVIYFKSGLYKKNNAPKWIVTNLGSEMTLFHKLDEYKQLIENVLHNCDLYSAECERDYDLVRNFIHEKNFLPCLPNAGGLDTFFISKLRNKFDYSQRNKIMIKGHQSLVGRALEIVKILPKIFKDLKDFELIFYSVTQDVKIETELLMLKYPLKIKCIGSISHSEILELFSKSRMYIGFSISDGISTSMLEAMACGAIPIQSNTACTNEWIKNDYNGYSVNIGDDDNLIKAIKNSIHNKSLFESAFNENIKIINDRCNEKKIRKQAKVFYEV